MASELYPDIEPIRTHRIAVDPPHELFVEESGNPDGIPVVFLHGGPGGGAKPFQRRTFDPRRFRIVTFDQRGCGRSTPSAELDGNTTQALIGDIETIRERLGIERWLVAGGSWGSLLTLAYAIAHPDRCLGLRVHGVFLGTPDETRFWFHGIGRFFPEAFEAFEAHVAPDERDDLLAAYYRRLVDPDPDVHMPAAQALRGFSARTQTLVPNAAHVGALTQPRAALEIARIFAHYCSNRFFLPPGHILGGLAALADLPCEIVQGRYDVVTPPRAALFVHRRLPQSRMTIVDLANHVATLEAPALSGALRAATDRLADALTVAPSLLSIEDYLAPRACHSPVLSEDGTQLAFISDETGFDQLWTLDLAAGAPPRLRLALPEKVGTVAFRPGSRDIAFTTDVGGDERHQIHLLEADALAARPLTRDEGVVNAWGGFGRSGRIVAYASNAGHPSDMAVHILDLTTGETSTVVEGTGWRTAMNVTPDGQALLVQDNEPGSFDATLSLVPLDGGAPVMLLPRCGAHVNAARWIEDGARLLVVTDRGEAFHGLARIDAATATFEWIVRPEADIELLAVQKDESRLVYALNEEGFTRLVLRVMASGAETTVPLPFRGRATSLALTPDGAAVVVALAGFHRPSRIVRIDLASGEATTLAQGSSLLDDAATVEPSIVSIGTFDGAQVPAFLFEPAGPAPDRGRPALVIVHGGPESQYAAHWRSDVQFLVRRGWTVVAPNVRGSTGYGRAWQAADDLHHRVDAVRDLKAVRDWVAARPDVDDARMVVYGQSYGGFMVLAALTEHPHDWAAGAEFYGIADFNTLLATTGPWRRTLRAAEYGDPDTAEGRALLAEISPLRKVGKITVPLFIAHGLDDPRVPPGESELVYAALRGRGHPCELVRIDHEGHGFSRLPNRRTVYRALMGFLDMHVGNMPVG